MRARLYDRALARARSQLRRRASAITFPRMRSSRRLASIEGTSVSGSSPRSSGCGLPSAANPRVYCRRPARSRERRTWRSGGTPISPVTIVKPAGIAAIVAPGGEFGLEAGRAGGQAARAAGRLGVRSLATLCSRVSSSIASGRPTSATALSRRRVTLASTAESLRIPQLLEWLASEIDRQGYSLKAMHRLILESAAFRQSSRFDPAALRRDAGNRLVWQRAPVRLQAEMVRDAMLCVAGVSIPGSGARAFSISRVHKAPGTAAILYKSIDPWAPGTNRRTLFRAWLRGGRSHLLDAFDCPDPSTSAPRRAVTTTPLQALSMMNNALVLHLSGSFCRPPRARGWRRRGTASRPGLPAGARALAGARRAKPRPCGWWNGQACRPSRGRFSIATSSFTLIERHG